MAITGQPAVLLHYILLFVHHGLFAGCLLWLCWAGSTQLGLSSVPIALLLLLLVFVMACHRTFPVAVV